MFKYIKWELINEIKSKKVLFGIVALVYLLVLILPNSSDNLLVNSIVLAFIIIFFATLALTFVYGANRTMNSYKNQTFLLESMLPLSPSKILLAKYILAILFDFVFCIIFILGLAVLLSKENINLIETLLQYFLQSDASTKTIIFRIFFLIITTTIAFTSLLTLLYIGIKSFFPNGKGLKIVSYIAGFFVLDIISSTLFRVVNSSANGDLIYSIVMLILAVICYVGSVWFIENKLEVYN